MPRHTGFAHLPLHTGKAPSWLFSRMIRLSREIAAHIVAEYGAAEMLRRLADPFWFQAFGCVLGFDWHSSGVTTTVTGALKEAIQGAEHEFGFYAGGGKGRTSRLTPGEIVAACDRTGADAAPLVRASRLTAKVDSVAVQDGFQLYHHAFFFTPGGHWCVVQQGMNDETSTARRYHWLSDALRSFVEEPHAAICSDSRVEALDLVSAEHDRVRAATTELAGGDPAQVLEVVRRYAHGGPKAPKRRARGQRRFSFVDAPAAPDALGPDAPACPACPERAQARDHQPAQASPGDAPVLTLPRRHALMLADVDPRRLQSVLLETYRTPPRDFETLIETPGVGARTVRALALVAEVIHGTPLSTRDPARFAFAHGGKDGTPYPVDRATYDRTITVLEQALERAKVDDPERVRALKRLHRWAKRRGTRD